MGQWSVPITWGWCISGSPTATSSTPRWELSKPTSGLEDCATFTPNNYCLLPKLTHVPRVKDLPMLQDLLDQHGWTDHVAGLMPDSAWCTVCMTKVEFTLYHDLAPPMIGPTGQPTRQTPSLPRCFERPICDPAIHKHCFCIFRCLVQRAGLDEAHTLQI